MSERASLPSVAGVVALFTLAGPLVAGVLAPLVLLLGGPLGLLLYPVYLVFWLPSFYILLAPPFFVTGLLYAAAIRRVPPRLAVALASGLAGVAVALGLRALATGTVAILTPAHLDAGTDAASTIWLALLALAATAACWSLIRVRDRAARALRVAAWPRSLRRATRVLAAVATVAVVGSAAVLSRPSPPRTAWDRCRDADDLRDEIRDCSTIIDAPAEPADRRLKALENRLESYRGLAAVAPSDAEAIARYGHMIEDAEAAERLFGARETIALAYARLHRGQSLAAAGDTGRAVADLDEAVRLDGDGLLGRQARADRARLLARPR